MQAGVLSPDPERLLGRTVGDREQYRLFFGGVAVGLPRRHHEHVVRPPLQHFPVHGGGAAAFRTDEDGAVGRAVLLAFEAFGNSASCALMVGRTGPPLIGLA
jgi:hypothetical protein